MKIQFTPLNAIKFIALCFTTTLLVSCSKNDVVPDNRQPGQPNSSPGQTTVNTPVNVNLLLGYRNGNLFPTRLVLTIPKIGTQNVNVKTVFDTGSEGLVLTAQSVIPPNLVTANGINLNGNAQLDINGITVTSHQDSASYGNAPGIRVYYGQIAYSSVVIGDASGHVTTRPMPFLLVYKGIIKATGKTTTVDPNLDGICGVASQSLSTQDVVTSRKDLRSPFAYINYGNGVLSGFKLQSYSTFYNATVPGQATAGNLQLSNAPLLQVGVTNDAEQGFTIQQKHIANNGLVFSDQVNGKFAIAGKSFNAGILFDTGTPQGVSIAAPESFGNQPQLLNDQTSVSFTSNEGYNYTYLADKGAQSTKLNPSAQIGRSIIGLQFFAGNSFLIDYTNHNIGIINR